MFVSQTAQFHRPSVNHFIFLYLCASTVTFLFEVDLDFNGVLYLRYVTCAACGSSFVVIVYSILTY